MPADPGVQGASHRTPSSGADRPRFRRVFVLIIGATGSTIVGRALNAHPSVVTTGELLKVEGRESSDVECSCGSCLSECAYWANVSPLLLDESGRMRSFSPALFDRIATSLGGRVLVDTSKKVCWQKTRWPWSVWNNSDTGYLLLVRDPRGFAASALRKGQPVDEGMRRYLRWMVRLEQLRRRAGDRALLVDYEDLCEAPAEELRRICHWMGIAFHSPMQWPGRHEHHLLSTNVSTYISGSVGIQRDDRWLRELDAEAIDQVERATALLPWLRQRYASDIRPPALWRRFAFRLRCELERLGP